MSEKISIDPVTRIEGHLAVRVEVESNKVTQAWCSGEMFRGFEVLLRGRHPLDAQQITQRICGVCPIGHGTASILAQDMAFNVLPTENGMLLRNMILGANYLQSHIVHFYQLCALDFVDITAIAGYEGKDAGLLRLKRWVTSELSSGRLYPAAPFLPRYEGDYITNKEFNLLAIAHYLQALDMRALAHEAAAIFSGKMPHAAALVPGGVTERATADRVAAYKSRLLRLKDFIDSCYAPDIIEVAKAYPQYFALGKGCGQFLSYGVFHETRDGAKKFFPPGVIKQGNLEALDPKKIMEEVRYSFFSSASSLHPSKGETVAAPEKTDAYTWLKAPRYDGLPMEVGPLARVLVAYMSKHNPALNKLVDEVLAIFNATPEALNSALGRHAARAIESKLLVDKCLAWADRVVPGAPTCEKFEIPKKGNGYGLTEAARGALGHWIEVENGKIANYQCVVPTTWNCSPRDDKGIAGPVEQSLIGTPVANAANPLEAARVVRSFDPCIACAVH